jgi:hypothetical protein
MSSPTFFGEGSTPRVTDTRWRILQKILGATIDGGGGGGGGGSGAFTPGTGNPEGVVVGSPGDRFWDTVNNFQYTKVTGTATTTGWFNS